MKKIYTLLTATLLCLNFALAQNKLNIVIFSEDGEPFYAFVNGVKQNATAETNVRITDLTAESFSFRIVFANSGNEPITKNQYLPFGSEYTFKIKRDKKGVLVMKPFGQVELAEAPAANNSIVYHSTELPASSNTSTTGTTAVQTTTTTTETVNVSTNTNGYSTNQQVNTTGGTTTTGENVNMNINVGANGLNMNVNVNGTGMNEDVNMDMNGGQVNSNNTTYTTTTTTTTTNTSTTGGNTVSSTNAVAPSNSTCYYAIDNGSFEKMKTSISSKPFSDTKMSTAKQATKNSCLSVNQVREIMNLFDMDDDKLAYAKYAYDYCMEKNNFYQVSDAFSFSSTTDELNAFLETK